MKKKKLDVFQNVNTIVKTQNVLHQMFVPVIKDLLGSMIKGKILCFVKIIFPRG